MTVRVTRLLPNENAEFSASALAWDLPRRGKPDTLNDQIVSCLERLKDACPELNTFEIVTVTASGSPYRVRDFEPGYKNMQRSSFPDRVSVRQSVGFQAALRRATTSQTWTEVVTGQISAAADLTKAAKELPCRLKARDNPRHRATWRTRIDKVSGLLGSMQPPPIAAKSDPSTALSHKDNADRMDDETTGVLRSALDAINNACPQEGPHKRGRLASAIALRESADKIDEARRSTRVHVQGLGSVFPEELSETMRVNANLLAALNRRPNLDRLIQADDPIASAIQVWNKVTDEENALSEQLLRGITERIPGTTVQLVENPRPATWALSSRSWALLTPLASLDPLLEALKTLDTSTREQLGPYTAILCVNEDDRDGPAPISPSVAGRGTFLGVGFKLSSNSADAPLLIPDEDARAWSRAAGLRTLDAVTAPAIEIGQLINRSHEAARRRMRKLPDDVNTTIEGSTNNTDDSRSNHHVPVGAPDINDAWTFLHNHVVSEEDGRANVFLSEVALNSVTSFSVDSQGQELMSALATVNLGRLDQVLREAGGYLNIHPVEGS